ncbi:MAG: NAD(P)/FAD-dependent oxidoreductase [Candidatus Omnitrophica bacterium]|nr:NAD(P)/FAD-dependent oxidoreductase [Candidatus Omnitrophota bacterium]
METTDITIIGAGVVGLSIASQVAQKNRNVVLVERHSGFGQETSSRNSEVIHAGIYYPEGFLKAKLCVAGNIMLYRICQENKIPYKQTGKLIVAVTEKQVPDLEDLLEKGKRNGVENLSLISSKKVGELEPHITACAALFVPSAGIIDSHRLMKFWETKAKDSGASIIYGCEVKSIEKISGGYRVGVNDSSGETFFFSTRILINSSGLESGNIAARAGIDIDEAGYRISYCKGEYFRVGGGKHKLAQRLIYPTPPKPGFVGIHTVPDLQEMMKLGPYDYYVDKINYDVDETNRELFYRSVKPFLPFIELEDLKPDTSGIHPKIQKPGEPIKDFIITHEEKRGLPGFINLVGIESPGLTSSPAIGSYVEKMVAGII